MRKISLLLAIFLFSTITITAQNAEVTQGTLFALTNNGENLGASPLKHTNVSADISGFLARVTVKQEFENNFSQPIEAIYTFPLSQNSAVDKMTMTIGSRVIRGKIKKREEAKKIYEQAKAQGKTASLLNQERPNIFTQAIANILPGEKIIIEISYVETLKYTDGKYEFVFPMVVGTRYSPASVDKSESTKVTPPIAKIRAGHDISIKVNLDAGVPVENISSTLHEIVTQNLSSNSAKIKLQNAVTIPNKDFILKYDVTGKRINDAILTHRNGDSGFFTMLLSPPDNFSVKDISPKEIVFVLDTSGSMGGFPIEKAKEAMKMSLEGLYPNDTFNLITFAGDTHILFDSPVPATPENLAMAQEFLSTRNGGGGTEMMKAIKAALAPSDSKEHLRIVNFMTDGYISNESEIIAEIKKHPNARVFSFGIGNSVNRYLLDKMSEAGRGEVEYVSLKDDGSAAAKRFHERIRNPLLTDISIDWNGISVADVYPKRNPDLFDAKPVMIYGRYKKGETGTIKLKGKVGGQNYEREINVDLPEREENNDVLATLWARTRIDDLMSEMRLTNNEKAKKELEEIITNLGLEFRLLTQYTSFVAVEEVVRTEGGRSVKVEVPVELPEGVRGNISENISNLPITGRSPLSLLTLQAGVNATRNTAPTVGTGSGSGSGVGNGSGVSRAGYVSGQRSSQTNITLDGVEVNKPSSAVMPIILQKIKTHNKALRSLTADIQMEKFDSTLSTSDKVTGTLNYLGQKNKPVRLRVDWTKPIEETLLLKNGKYLIHQQRFKKTFTGKISDSKGNEIFNLITNKSLKNIKAEYNIKMLSNEKINQIELWHMELTPKKATDYKTIEIWIDTNGMILKAKATEQNNDWTSILLSNLKKNTQNFDVSIFNITLPKDTKIIK